MARGSASPILVLVPLLLGLLAISSIPNVIAETTTTIENPIDQNFPDMATTDLPTTMNQNLALKYRTVLTKYVSGSCSTMINKQNIVNTTQNITALGEGILEINEITTNNDSLSPISNKEFNYKISNNSYMPINTSSEMPTALIGEWEHYYPGSMNSSRLINHQEVAYLLYKYSPKIVTITQTGTQSFILGNLSTTAMVYEGIYTINDYYEGWGNPLYLGNVTIKMYFEISSGLLLRSTSQISLAKEKDPTNQIYWEIEKYITQINEISINYEYSLPTSPLPTTTTDQPRSPLDTWTIIGWIMLIAGGAAIIIGAGRWSKVPEDPTSMQDE